MRRATDSEFGYGVEQPSEFYDATYAATEHWKQHYTQSRYYCLWTIIADRIRRMRTAKVLDIGCGPGQVACLLRDLGVKQYKGLDFSPARVAQARSICPEYEFYMDDVFETRLFETYDYNCVLALEFLEHIDADVNVLAKIRSGTLVLGTVPNFPAAGHVRHFNGIKEVQERYESILNGIDVSTVAADDHGKAFYIIEGRR